MTDRAAAGMAAIIITSALWHFPRLLPPRCASLFRMLCTRFVSTKKGGQGIRLMFVRAVLTRHGCMWTLAPGQGTSETRFAIWFGQGAG